jgi:digeranylgeranylglycerophospholipid reductase
MDAYNKYIMMDVADVVVIGSGPAGSSTANIVAGAGYNVLLIEKDERPGKNNVCGGGMSEQLANKLKLPDMIVEKWIPYEVHHFPWGVFENRQRHATVLRDKFDRYLAEMAIDNGSKLLTYTKAVNIKRRDGKMVIYTSTDKNISTILSNLVIFADGVNTLAKKFDIGFKKDNNNTSLGLVYEIEWKDNPIDHYELFYDKNISRWGYGWIFPKKDLLNIGVGCRISKRGGNIKDMMNYFIRSPAVSTKIQGRKILNKKAALIPLAPAREIHDQSMLVVGDAAGMVYPFFGAGIENAVVAGEIAGKVAVRALEENNFSKLFLSIYKKQWEKTGNYALMKRQSTMSKFLLPLSNLDAYIIQKFMNLFYINDVSSNEKMRIALYPSFRE